MPGPEDRQTPDQVRAQLTEERQLVERLQRAGLDTQADRLAADYHGRQISGLAADVYASARGEGQPPTGWIRGSERPDLLAERLPGMNPQQIQDLMRPAGSGYRAEIYLPDPAVLGPDARPVLAFKGSTGPILDPAAPGGRRESGPEDFLANNIPQGLGLRTDYYDRAMNAARVLSQQPGFDFEITGHSLGGGMASAAGAISGRDTITFNAAGLHPETPRRFAEENGGLPVYDTRRNVRAYQVSGEMLTDAQTGIQSLDEARRQQGGRLANDIGSLLQTPGIREAVDRQVDQLLPEHARGSARAAIGVLADGQGVEALRNLPTAAGEIRPMLDPYGRGPDGRAALRPEQMALSELGAYAGPLTDVLSTAATAGRAGRVVGEGVRWQGQVVEQGLNLAGDGLRLTASIPTEVGARVTGAIGTLDSMAVRGTGEVVATVRVGAGHLEAGIDRAQGNVQWGAGHTLASGFELGRELPGPVGRWFGRQADGWREYGDQSYARNEQEAQRAVRGAQSDAETIRTASQRLGGHIEYGASVIADTQRAIGQGVGQRLEQGADALGHGVRSVTDQAPAAGATVGATLGLVGAFGATHAPVTPGNAYNLYQTVTVIREGQATAGEAVFRHGMGNSMIPSLDSSIEAQERNARGLLEQAQERERAPQRTGMLLDNPLHPANGLFNGIGQGLEGAGLRTGAAADANLAGALTASTVQTVFDGRLPQATPVLQVAASEERGRVFAFDTDAPHQRIAHAEVAPGRAQSLEASTRLVDDALARAQTPQAQSPEQLQAQRMAQPEIERASSGPRMG